ncbi:hypothetical protein EVA_14155, partial [gut metagenome]
YGVMISLQIIFMGAALSTQLRLNSSNIGQRFPRIAKKIKKKLWYKSSDPQIRKMAFLHKL